MQMQNADADAKQMQMQNADADAKQMQNAECGCRMHYTIADSKNTLALSETACAPEALGRIPESTLRACLEVVSGS